MIPKTLYEKTLDIVRLGHPHGEIQIVTPVTMAIINNKNHPSHAIVTSSIVLLRNQQQMHLHETPSTISSSSTTQPPHSSWPPASCLVAYSEGGFCRRAPDSRSSLPGSLLLLHRPRHHIFVHQFPLLPLFFPQGSSSTVIPFTP